MQFSLIYVTFETNDNARQVAKYLLENRLISCANIFPPIQSIYRWDNEVQEESEVVAIFKTRAELFEQVSERIKILHSYDVPCIVAIPIEQADEAFASWITKQTVVL